MAKMTNAENATVVSSLAGNQREVESAECRKILTKAERRKMPIATLSPNPHNPRESIDSTVLVGSISRNGYDPSYPIVCDSNGRIYRGHRRHHAVCTIRDDYPELFAELFPDDCVECLVIDDLSEMEGFLLLYDHGESNDRVGLSEWEYVTSVIPNLIKIGIATQTGIAEHFGKSRTWAQQLLAVAKMPKFVRETFKPVLLNYRDELKKTKLRKQDILVVARDYVNFSASDFKSVWATWVDGTHPDSQSVQSKNGGSKEILDYSEWRNSRNLEGTPIVLTELLESAETIASFKMAIEKMSVELENLRKSDLQVELESTKNRLATVESVLTKAQAKRVSAI